MNSSNPAVSLSEIEDFFHENSARTGQVQSRFFVKATEFENCKQVFPRDQSMFSPTGPFWSPLSSSRNFEFYPHCRSIDANSMAQSQGTTMHIFHDTSELKTKIKALEKYSSELLQKIYTIDDERCKAKHDEQILLSETKKQRFLLEIKEEESKKLHRVIVKLKTILQATPNLDVLARLTAVLASN